MSYGLVKQLQTKANLDKANAREPSVNISVDANADIRVITIDQVCQALGVSRSGYYTHQATQKSAWLSRWCALRACTSKPPLQPVRKLTAVAD